MTTTDSPNPRGRSHRRRIGSGLLTLSMALSPLAALGGTAQAAEDPDAIKQQVISDSMKNASGTVTAFVRFKGKGAFEQTQPAGVRAGTQAPVNTSSQVQAIASQVQSQAQQVSSQSGAQVLYTTHNAVRGVAVRGDAESIRALASRSDVEKISPILPKYRQNAGAAIDAGSLATWTGTTNPAGAGGYTGKGVKIAVIDSGIDYTHTDFGGSGKLEDYEKASKLTELPSADSGLINRTKVAGGYDLVGDAYDGTNTATPDGNPLDCTTGGHGTHVAGTAAGYGVNADGTTFTGDYSKLTAEQLKTMKIGPGVAPDAEIYAFRVFGCSGSTNVVIEALDRTLDPNGDGDFSDRVNVVNMSLGGEFSPQDDPEAYAVDALTRAGVLSVISAGNANDYSLRGDTYSNSGHPATASSAITVANAYGSTRAVDAAELTDPATGTTRKVRGDYSVSYPWAQAGTKEFTGELTAISENNRYACNALSADEAAAVKGKWVLIDWAKDDGELACGSKVRFDNLEAAGAKGVLLAGNDEEPGLGIAGNDTLPGFRLAASAAKDLRAQITAAEAAGKPLTVRLGNELKSSLRVDTDKKDQLNPMSARGFHGSYGYTKPDIAAPGSYITSAAVATGNNSVTFSGTSMAAPYVTGSAALVMQSHPSYTPAQVKSALMNTATHDVRTESGAAYAVDRVGAGRVDTLAAVQSKSLVYNADKSGTVSLSFGVLEYAPDAGVQTLTREVTVENTDSVAHTYALSYAESTNIPGVEYSFPSSVTLAPGETKKFELSVRIDPSKLEKTRDAAMDATQNATDYYTGNETVPTQYRQYIASASGRLVLTEDNGQNLRVPIHVAPKPVSTMHAAEDTVTFTQKPSSDEAQKADTGWTKSQISLRGTEVNQGGYRSLLGAFEYGASVDRVAPTSLSLNSNVKANLQYVGASSDAPALKAAGGNADDGTLRFGISTWANWDVVSYENTFTVEIDTDGNNRADYKLVTDRAKGLDYPLVRLYGYKNGNLVELGYYPLNGAWGDVDTNMMDTNTLIMSAPLKDLGLTSANNPDIQYRVSATTQYEWGNVSETGWIKYRPFSPKLWFSGDSSSVAGLHPDAPTTTLTAHRSADAIPALGESGTPAKALLLHLHNGTGDLSGTNGAKGDRAEVLNIKEQQTEYITPSRFSDVKSGDQFYTEISWLAQRRITTGYPDGTYRPLESVERGAMAAFFYRMQGSPQFTAPSTPSFKDVPTTHPFYKEIEWMKAQGITTGYSDGTFRPSAPVNRDAMAAFFYRAAGSPHVDLPATSHFSDVSTDNQFYREITWLALKGISTGWPDGTYRPVTPIARDAMAAFIYRYTEKVANQAGR